MGTQNDCTGRKKEHACLSAASWLLKYVAALRSSGHVGIKFEITAALVSLIFDVSI